MTVMYSAILSLGHMEEELSTACRAAADALELLSNLRPCLELNSTWLITTKLPNQRAAKSTIYLCGTVYTNARYMHLLSMSLHLILLLQINLIAQREHTS